MTVTHVLNIVILPSMLVIILEYISRLSDAAVNDWADKVKSFKLNMEE